MTSPAMVSFTARVYRVFALASDVATSLGHNVVSPTHMAIGVLREGEGVAVSALHLEGIDLNDLGRALSSLLDHPIDTGELVPGRPLPPNRELLAQARAEAKELGHGYVGTEHLLLALLRDRTGATARLLARHGLSHEQAKARILAIIDPDASAQPV